MNKHEAIQALKEGKKVSHATFYPDEFIHLPKAYRHTDYGASGGVHDEHNTPLPGFWKYRTAPRWDKDWRVIS
jgi:hypothetical protein